MFEWEQLNVQSVSVYKFCLHLWTGWHVLISEGLSLQFNMCTTMVRYVSIKIQ